VVFNVNDQAVPVPGILDAPFAEAEHERASGFPVRRFSAYASTRGKVITTASAARHAHYIGRILSS
jgi:hypothetical protein